MMGTLMNDSAVAVSVMLRLFKAVPIFASITLLALGLSLLSMLIQNGADESARETIGVQKLWGFPVAYRTTAPGLSWSRFDGMQFAMNSAIWCVIVAFCWAIVIWLRRARW